MAAHGIHNPVALQPRRLIEQTKANMRGRVELLPPRSGLHKRICNTSSRNSVNKMKSMKTKRFFVILGIRCKRSICSCM